MENTLAQSCITGPKVCLSTIHLFSGRDGSGQGQITDKEKKKQAIQKYCCNNKYICSQNVVGKARAQQTATEDSRDAKTQPENYRQQSLKRRACS
jgi:hypothetical protein